MKKKQALTEKSLFSFEHFMYDVYKTKTGDKDTKKCIDWCKGLQAYEWLEYGNMFGNLRHSQGCVNAMARVNAMLDNTYITTKKGKK